VADESVRSDEIRELTIDSDSREMRVELRPRGHALLRGTVQTSLQLDEGARVFVAPLTGTGPTICAPVSDGRFEARGISEGEHSVTLRIWTRAHDRLLFGGTKITLAPGATEASVTVILEAP